jgi:2-polyprenyl-3-methyl-5-hydroxy-6-metoxy-1,4-benzoquinol methylase
MMERLRHKILKKIAKLSRSASFSKEYYRLQHKFSPQYQQNNWLIEHKERLLPFLGESVLEVGCGNGKFLYSIAGDVNRAVGIDWAAPPITEKTPKNIEFKQADVLTYDFAEKRPNLICSADVLEHFPSDALPGLIKNMHLGAKYNFHVIACYDDGHSHVTVQPADWWLKQFQTISPDYRIEASLQADAAVQRAKCIITNLPYRA